MLLIETIQLSWSNKSFFQCTLLTTVICLSSFCNILWPVSPWVVSMWISVVWEDNRVERMSNGFIIGKRLRDVKGEPGFSLEVWLLEPRPPALCSQSGDRHTHTWTEARGVGYRNIRITMNLVTGLLHLVQPNQKETSERVHSDLLHQIWALWVIVSF